MKTKNIRTCGTAHGASTHYGRADERAKQEIAREMRPLGTVWRACKAWEERNGIKTETSLFFGR